MKYRIKNETERNLINALFGIPEFESEFQDKSLTIRASFAGDAFGVWFFETEPVKELEDGWNPYPQLKPKRAGHYLVAIKSNTVSDTVDHDIFNGNTFTAWGARVLAWQELPKIWKDL